jgi:hypothetical protein
MDRVLVSIPVGRNPAQRSRVEDRLHRILLAAPAGSYLFRDDERMGIALQMRYARRPSICLWDEIH